MKILICSINYTPELTGIGKYSGEMGAWLADRGHQVRVVTAPPYYPEWKVHAGHSSMSYRQEEVAGTRVWRCPAYVPVRPTGLSRIIHLLSFALSSLPVMIRQIFWRPDVVVSIEPPLFCAPVSWFVARAAGGKCLLHVQDLEVDVAFALGIFSSLKMQKLVGAIESWIMRQYDAVSTISESMLNRLECKGVSPNRSFLFPNWADIENIKFDPDGRNLFRRAWQVDEQTSVALYSGNIARKQGLDLVIDAAEILQNNKSLLFIICGDGPAKADLEDRAKKKRLSNVKFMSLQPAEKLAALLSAADVHLVIQTAGAADLVMPSKLTNILAVGGNSIITASEKTELGRLLLENPGLGDLCPPNNVGRLVEALISFLSERSAKKSMYIRSFAENILGKKKVLLDLERRLILLADK